MPLHHFGSRFSGKGAQIPMVRSCNAIAFGKKAHWLVGLVLDHFALFFSFSKQGGQVRWWHTLTVKVSQARQSMHVGPFLVFLSFLHHLTQHDQQQLSRFESFGTTTCNTIDFGDSDRVRSYVRCPDVMRLLKVAWSMPIQRFASSLFDTQPSLHQTKKDASSLLNKCSYFCNKTRDVY